LIKNKEERNKMIKHFRKNSTLSLKEIGSIFGGLSESSICKILSK
jgi:DNA-directed RNA polymerase specialized sigma subunit